MMWKNVISSVNLDLSDMELAIVLFQTSYHLSSILHREQCLLGIT